MGPRKPLDGPRQVVCILEIPGCGERVCRALVGFFPATRLRWCRRHHSLMAENLVQVLLAQAHRVPGGGTLIAFVSGLVAVLPDDLTSQLGLVQRAPTGLHERDECTGLLNGLDLHESSLVEPPQVHTGRRELGEMREDLLHLGWLAIGRECSPEPALDCVLQGLADACG